MASKAETRLRNRIKKRLEKVYGEDIYIQHPHGSMYSSGQLDLYGCLFGYFFALEVKMPTNKRGATKLQQEHIEAIKKSGGVAIVVTSPQEAEEALLVFS